MLWFGRTVVLLVNLAVTIMYSTYTPYPLQHRNPRTPLSGPPTNPFTFVSSSFIFVSSSFIFVLSSFIFVSSYSVIANNMLDIVYGSAKPNVPSYMSYIAGSLAVLAIIFAGVFMKRQWRQAETELRQEQGKHD